jgi:hypothetical protein
MIFTPLALSITNSVTQVGAVGAFVALLGIAILSLLVFSQAREIKRLREWAGRAPERSAELEQRISAQATSRAQVASTTAGAQMVPRTAPLSARGPSTIAPASRVAPVASLAGAAADAALTPGATQAPQSTPAISQPVSSPAASQNLQPAVAATPGTATETSSEADVKPAGAPVDGSPVSQAAASNAIGEPSAQQANTESAQKGAGAIDAKSAAPVPATVAGAARAPLAPAAGAEPSSDESRLPPAPAPPSAPIRSSAPRAPSRPPAPAVAPPRSSAAGARKPPVAGTRSPDSYRFLKDEPTTRGRGRALIVGGSMLAVVAVVLVLSLSGGSHKNPSTSSTPTSATNTGPSRKHTSVTHAAAQVNPGAISVSVLNGTEINGLAHRIAASLQEKGYKRATPLDGHPPGAYPKTIVEYESGHSADARSIAQVLDISANEVQPMQAAMLPLISGATVAIVAGEDQPTPASGPTETPGAQNSGASESGESGAGATG